ncbi:MAG TPA: DUF4157 domain-containing protein [Kofleriaceae bacterium]|nr:DUF4157 domain-containing protein [Kofleriaceae bacterium]
MIEPSPSNRSPAQPLALDFARARGLAELVEVLSTRTADPVGEVCRAALASAELHVAKAAWTLLPAVTRAGLVQSSHTPTTARSKGPAMAAAADRRAATIFRCEQGGEPDIDAPEVEEALRRMGAGESLPQALRLDLEARLQIPLSRVRIHADEVAANAADAVRARAFTVGEDVFFARGAFDPTSQEGRELLLHELTHVAQGYEGRLPGDVSRRVSQPDEAVEREAQQVARSGSRPGAGADRAATPRGGGLLHASGVILRDPPPVDRANWDRPDPAHESELQALLRRAGITPPRLTSALPPAEAQRIIGLLTTARATPTAYGPRMVALYLMREVQSSGGSTLANVVQRMRQFDRIVIVRPDGYISGALSGRAIQRAGRVQGGSDGLRAGEYEIGRFYYSDGGIFYQVGPNLERVGNPVGELALEHGLGPIDAVLDGVEDALRGMVEGIVRLITHPIQSIQDLANLPGAIRALIANSPEYWARFRAMPLNDQIREISRITTTVALTYGSAAGMTTRISGAAGQIGNITVNALRITQGGELAMATVTVPVGQVATALSGIPGGLYVLHMANTSGNSGGSSGGSGGGPAFTEQDIQTLISDTNRDFPLTRPNAEQVLTGPPGTRVRVAGPGGAGADVEFIDATGQTVLRREVKAINGGVNSFNSEVSHAATQLGRQGEIWVQVPAGTDVNAWLRAFRGRRDAAALARYSGVELRAFDPAGTVLYSGPVAP